ncbi:hypothetical protein [Sinorhizobium meliloti]|uniref:hypothetical protein n=1 Tax=Rhizobium meliloti TaxID=382 RepID=UPI000EFBDB0E|nr:hypothetical protein [Sinorhizobium meliloti]RMC64876.1 hypothetical protein EBB04_22260 [Sinorhizobium meliloti]
MRTQQQAEEKLRETQYPKAELEETALVHATFLHENDKLWGLEKTILDITKANYLVLGAVLLVGNSSFLTETYGEVRAIILGVAAILVLSLGASVMVTFHHKYLEVQHKRVKVLQKALWRRRPLEWVEDKLDAEGLSKEFGKANELTMLEFVKYNYSMKHINLLPILIALAVAGLLYQLPEKSVEATPAVAPTTKSHEQG